MATKNKTNRSLKKRFKITATGKIKRRQCGKRHLNAHFTAKRRRQLRNNGVIVNTQITFKYLIAMNMQ